LGPLGRQQRPKYVSLFQLFHRFGAILEGPGQVSLFNIGLSVIFWMIFIKISILVGGVEI
jgi:hypothetical protein